LEEIRGLDLAIYEAKKKLSVMETNLRREQQKYEAASVERSFYEKTYRETTVHTKL